MSTRQMPEKYKYRFDNMCIYHEQYSTVSSINQKWIGNNCYLCLAFPNRSSSIRTYPLVLHES